MTSFSIGMMEIGDEVSIEFADVVQIVQGRAIVSAADWGAERLEFGLSGRVMLRIFIEKSGLHASLISTANPGDVPPLLLKLASESHRAPIKEIEARLRAFRTLYAIVRLDELGELSRVGGLLESNAEADIEELLPSDEHLLIESIGPGSWLVTIWTQVRNSYNAVLIVVSLLYPRGREAFLTKLDSEAKLKQIDAERAAFKLLTERTDYALSLADKMPTEDGKKLLAERVEAEVLRLLTSTGESADAVTKRLLGP
jgi:hypothetical protein